jgi:hypothetical protein
VEQTDVTADVLDFSLAWTGRHFWLTWAETRDGALRHRHTLLSRSGTSLVHDPPVTVRTTDDAVGPGGTLSYGVDVPAGTALLRVTLAWDDAPGPAIRAPITLRVVPPGAAGVEYRGNVWDRDVSALVPDTGPLPPVGDNVAQVIRPPARRGPVPGPRAGRGVRTRAAPAVPGPGGRPRDRGHRRPAPYPKFANTHDTRDVTGPSSD